MDRNKIRLLKHYPLSFLMSYLFLGAFVVWGQITRRKTINAAL
jgi:hypothetical protein